MINVAISDIICCVIIGSMSPAVLSLCLLLLLFILVAEINHLKFAFTLAQFICLFGQVITVFDALHFFNESYIKCTIQGLPYSYTPGFEKEALLRLTFLKKSENEQI